MKKRVLFYSLYAMLMMVFINLDLPAQSVNYRERIHILDNNINHHLKSKETGLFFETTDSIKKDNKHAWLWPMCALIQASNEQERLEPHKNYMEPVVKAIDQYFSPELPPAFQDYITAERLSGKFYDDNQWIAIAYLDAYKRTKKRKYLEDSKLIYQFMMKGLDTASGGGLYWKLGDFETKNTCSNGPGILVALKLYKVTKDKQYLNAALDIYNWTYRKLESAEGLFYDAIKIPSGKIDKKFYTYNAGTMLQANVLLYQITGKQEYLTKAQRLAKAARAHFYKDGRLPGHYWFNAVMLRGYEALYAIDQNPAWIDFFIKDAEAIWANERDTRGMVGKRKHKSLIDQAAMIEIYSRLANFHAIDKFEADIVIYGGTSSGIIAAVQAVKLGKRVIVVSPDVHLGGLSSSGLGFTDTGDKTVIGGLARDFYHRVFLHYQRQEAWSWQKKEEYGNKGQGTPAIDGNERTMWIFEPHVAEKIMEDLVRENKIKVYRNEWLNRDNGVRKKAGRIVSIQTLSGKIFHGRMFIDATYEGDLMAATKVSYHIGREAGSVYDEKWNGIQTEVFQHAHHFTKNIDPYVIPGDKSSGLLAGISDQNPGVKGAGDRKLQAYCFRMCLTDNPENRIAFPKPDRYNAADYELLARVFQNGWNELFNKFDPIPNRKTDTNNHGPFSTDYIGGNYDYPEASYAERKKIIKAHENYQKGLFYFMCTDSRVPAILQKRLNSWGLAKDEFKDNGNWPYQLYIREARRMVSDYVMTEKEVLGIKEVTQSIGMGSYALDSHNTQRYVTPKGFVQNEGDIGVKPSKPYGIAYGAIVPKSNECLNLLVPVCLSSSHIAYGSVRMEPVFMILGQSAAIAAALAIDDKVSVQQVDFKKLKSLLVRNKQFLTL